LLAAPAYLDLVRIAAESARVAPDLSFFLDHSLPRIGSRAALETVLAGHISPYFFGDLISPAYPVSTNGSFVPPLAMFLIWLCLLLRLDKAWGWWVVVIVVAAMTLARPVFAFAVAYLGFNL
jgi:hypothetical protein